MIAALPLGACVNSAAELGQPPPVQLAVAQRTMLVPLVGDPHLAEAERVTLLRAVTELGGPEARAVRAHIVGAEPGDTDAVRRALIGIGIDPARITMTTSPHVARLLPSVTLRRSFVRTTECGAAITPAYLGDSAPSLGSVGRCVQANNLAAMLVDPADLVDPPALAPADGAYLQEGIEAWRADRKAALPDTSFDAPDAGASGGSSGGSSGSGYGGTGNAGSGLTGVTSGAGATTGATTATGSATAGNPLLTP